MKEHECSVLEQYDINIRSTRKIRGAVLCDTEQGLYLLKEVTVSKERILALGELYNCLENQEWCSVDKIVENKEGDYVTETENGTKYILKKWYSGRECDVRKPVELLEAVGTLAKIHLIMQHRLESPVSCAESIKQEYKKHNRELKKVRNYIRKCSPKGEFEFEFLKCFDEMYWWAEKAVGMLEESRYEQLYEESMGRNCLTHGEYNYHNVIVNNIENKNLLIAVTNFEKFKRDIQVEDLYYLLRKVMEKYGWKERLGDNMLNAYSAVKPLTEEETEYIKIRLAYPEKFWKTANAYYNSNKAWMPVKNLEKLGVAVCQTKEKERFLGNLFGNDF